MNKAIYNPYTQDQRAQYVQTRKAALALRPDITGAQFDATVRKDFAPQSPEVNDFGAADTSIHRHPNCRCNYDVLDRFWAVK